MPSSPLLAYYDHYHDPTLQRALLHRPHHLDKRHRSHPFSAKLRHGSFLRITQDEYNQINSLTLP